jgi:hypothetical protein
MAWLVLFERALPTELSRREDSHYVGLGWTVRLLSRGDAERSIGGGTESTTDGQSFAVRSRMVGGGKHAATPNF